MERGREMADERTKALEQVAEHFEARAAELDEFWRRFGEKQRYQDSQLYAKADGFREAAVHARIVAANGVQAAKVATKTDRPVRRGRLSKPQESEAPITTIPAPQPNPKPWEGATIQ